MSSILAKLLRKLANYIDRAGEHGLAVTAISKIEHLPNNAFVDLRVTLRKEETAVE